MASESPASTASPLAAVFKAYDVRGTVPDQLDSRVLYAIGVGFARFVSQAGGPDRRIVIARDMRASGVELSRAFIAGALSAGLGVVDLGLASTDLLYFASGRLDLAGAMLTASHNPAGYNGVKCCLAGARPIGQETGLGDIRRMAEEALRDAPDGEVAAVGDDPRVERLDLLDEFAAHVRSFVDVGALLPLKVVADTANGMGGLIVPRVFESLPFEVEILFPDLDGSFPNHPADPIQPENLVDLTGRVLSVGADVGLAFDGDADRVFLVDEKAQPVSGSLTTAIVAAAMLQKHPGSIVLHNLICSKAVPEVIRENGGTPLRTRVGHSFIKTVMAETGAVFGGEHSGHYYFRDNFRADSGIIAALVVLEVLSKVGEPLSVYRQRFERYFDSGEINTEVADPEALIALVAERYRDLGAKVDDLDGATIDLGDWWFNLRPSNTEPLLRLNLEAPTAAERDRRVAEVLELVHALAAESRRCP